MSRRIDVGLVPGTDPDAVEAAFESRITTQPYTISSPSDVAASLHASTSDFQSTTALIAAVALFVGAFLIFNTLSMTVMERVREVALLRAAGTTRSQIHSFVLLQAFLLGLAGSLLGIAVGYLLAAWLASALGSGTSIGSVRISGPSFPVAGAIIAVAVGDRRDSCRGHRARVARRTRVAGRGAPTAADGQPARCAAALADRRLRGRRRGRAGPRPG